MALPADSRKKFDEEPPTRFERLFDQHDHLEALINSVKGRVEIVGEQVMQNSEAIGALTARQEALEDPVQEIRDGVNAIRLICRVTLTVAAVVGAGCTIAGALFAMANFFGAF